MVARSTTAVLHRLGYVVTHLSDGRSAWEHLESRIHDFDALVLDLILPRMGGMDLAHRARLAGFDGTVIAISGLVMHVDPAALELLRIQRFLTKPFVPADLERALRGV